jgi:hypothetical protein
MALMPPNTQRHARKIHALLRDVIVTRTASAYMLAYTALMNTPISMLDTIFHVNFECIITQTYAMSMQWRGNDFILAGLLRVVQRRMPNTFRPACNDSHVGYHENCICDRLQLLINTVYDDKRRSCFHALSPDCVVDILFESILAPYRERNLLSGVYTVCAKMSKDPTWLQRVLKLINVRLHTLVTTNTPK